MGHGSGDGALTLGAHATPNFSRAEQPPFPCRTRWGSRDRISPPTWYLGLFFPPTNSGATEQRWKGHRCRPLYRGAGTFQWPVVLSRRNRPRCSSHPSPPHEPQSEVRRVPAGSLNHAQSHTWPAPSVRPVPGEQRPKVAPRPAAAPWPAGPGRPRRVPRGAAGPGGAGAARPARPARAPLRRAGAVPRRLRRVGKAGVLLSGRARPAAAGTCRTAVRCGRSTEGSYGREGAVRPRPLLRAVPSLETFQKVSASLSSTCKIPSSPNPCLLREHQ